MFTMWKKVFKWTVIIGVVIFVLMFAGKIWNFLFPTPPVTIPGVNDNPVVQVTPGPITPNVQHQIPAGQHAVAQIDIPPVHNTPGMINQQHVVPTAEGNTLIVTTSKIDWGFRLEPKVFLGYSHGVYAGLGANVFTVWRFNTDVLLGTNLTPDRAFSKIYLGAGVSYQVYQNTFLGVNVLESQDLDTTIGVNLNLKF